MGCLLRSRLYNGWMNSYYLGFFFFGAKVGFRRLRCCETIPGAKTTTTLQHEEWERGAGHGNCEFRFKALLWLGVPTLGVLGSCLRRCRGMVCEWDVQLLGFPPLFVLFWRVEEKSWVRGYLGRFNSALVREMERGPGGGLGYDTLAYDFDGWKKKRGR